MLPFGPQQSADGEEIAPPEPPNKERDWHASIAPGLRNHLFGKFVKAISPYSDPTAMHNQDLLTYARKTEKEFFEAAPDKEAYIDMLALKIHNIQKEQEAKRLNEQQQQSLAQQNEQCGSATPQQQAQQQLLAQPMQQGVSATSQQQAQPMQQGAQNQLFN